MSLIYLRSTPIKTSSLKVPGNQRCGALGCIYIYLSNERTFKSSEFKNLNYLDYYDINGTVKQDVSG
jgi:hypothetical protein